MHILDKKREPLETRGKLLVDYSGRMPTLAYDRMLLSTAVVTVYCRMFT